MLIYDEKPIGCRPNGVVIVSAIFGWSATWGHNSADLVKSNHFADSGMTQWGDFAVMLIHVIL